MTIIVTPPELHSTEDALVAFINHLRFQHAIDQHMLVGRSPEEKTLERLGEIRAKNTELEQKVRDLRHVNHELATAVEAVALAQNPKIMELEAQLKAERERSADLLNRLNDASLGPHAKEKDNLTRRVIDGDAAIVAGREALEAHQRLSEQPARGE